MKQLCMCCFALILLLLTGCGYRTLQTKEGEVQNAWQKLETACRERTILVPRFVQIIGEHLRHEAVLLAETEKAALKLLSQDAQTKPPANLQELDQFMASQRELTRALARLAVVEQLNQSLHRDDRYVAIHDRLGAVEATINDARSHYNLVAHDFNLTLNTFPHTITNAALLHYNNKEQLVQRMPVKVVMVN